MTSYPLVMALQYLLSQTGMDQETIDSCRKNLEDGYKRLVGYECKSGGFDWFGTDPGHEALTAYGLMQFTEMKKVIEVDSGMIERTKNWLMSRRDGKGGFERNSLALDNFGGAPQEHTDAYITWALTEAGMETQFEVEHLLKHATAKKDAYISALACICLYRHNRVEEARKWGRKLAELQKEKGSIEDEQTSITRSYGSSLIVEATALTVLGWLSDKEQTFLEPLNNALKFLNGSCKGGNFGSTQATLLALKAIVEYDKLYAVLPANGTFHVTINGKHSSKLEIEKGKNTLSFEDLGAHLKTGNNTIVLRMEKGFKMPYSVAIDFNCVKGDSSDQCKVKLHAKLNDTKLKEGTTSEVQVVVQNQSAESLPMTIAVIGIPGGLEVRVDKLKELVKGGVIDYYETLGRRVALYWRYFAEKEKKTVLLDVVAAVPGTYTGPASSAYLYYTNEHVCWVEGLRAEVV
eukprot:TRINITY_DN4176_c0_g1_i4.p1 TRINITY_DN4176_c0_g1~~TRINITY_DN4176_c0_g1_i4.p1  ORF type:complete len:462 (+),score=173.26 TRINITY_DN4176_c0_g1_i4:125-1510(+)